MTVEQIVRDQLGRATEHVPTAPNLETAVSRGRRGRRNRRAGIAGIATLAVAAAVSAPLAVSAFVTDPAGQTHESRVADQPPAAAPLAQTPTDYVPGTDIDDSMAAAVAELLPSLPAPDDVYPSDGRTAGPLPDSAFGQAQDWQAAYTTDSGGALIMMGRPEEIAGWRCSDCDSRKVDGGTLYHQTYATDDGGGTWWFGTYFVGDDGHFVNAFESVRADDEQSAAGLRQLSDGDLEALAEDPRLAF